MQIVKQKIYICSSIILSKFEIVEKTITWNRLSPIADPGGPHKAPYLVTMYEYCLLSGKDWWDLSLAAAQTNPQTITDKLE